MVGYEKAIKSLWDGKCTVTVLQSKKDEKNGRTNQEETILFEELPCRISFSRLVVTNDVNGAPQKAQSVKLIISNEYEIPAGSKIIFTQKGKTTVYKSSGEAAEYSHHQEIMLELFERWA